jgi:hypothetical protein
MNFSIRTTIRAYVAPKHKLSCSISLWRQVIEQLRKRGEGCHESGAFLLGYKLTNEVIISRIVYYDDLDSHALDSGIIMIDGSAYGRLWGICRKTRLQVIADIHTHPGQPIQSLLDRKNPMVSIPGHIGIIVPNFAHENVLPIGLGIYEYQGAHCWKDFFNTAAKDYFYVGFWG